MNCGKYFSKADDNQCEKGEKQRGASLVEYALLVALIAVVAIAAVSTLGGAVSQKMSAASSAVSGTNN